MIVTGCVSESGRFLNDGTIDGLRPGSAFSDSGISALEILVNDDAPFGLENSVRRNRSPSLS